MPDAKQRSKCPVMGLYYFLILNLFLPVRGLATGFLQLRSSSASLFGGNHAAAMPGAQEPMGLGSATSEGLRHSNLANEAQRLGQDEQRPLLADHDRLVLRHQTE